MLNEDLTELTYAVSVDYNSIEDIIAIRLQLPCNCLIDNCMLNALIYDSTPTVNVDNAQFVWYIHVTNARTFILKIILFGKFDDSISSQGQYALYGNQQSCAYGESIKVPQPCKTWGSWRSVSNTCDDITWFVLLFFDFVFFVSKSIHSYLYIQWNWKTNSSKRL